MTLFKNIPVGGREQNHDTLLLISTVVGTVDDLVTPVANDKLDPLNMANSELCQ